MNLFEIKPEFYYDNPDKSKKQAHLEAMVKSMDYVFSEKIDGNWSRFVSFQGEKKLQTRNISKVTDTYGEVQDKVPHIFSELSKLPDNNMILGELYLPGGDDKATGSILRCLPPKAIARQKDEKNKLHYRIFDIWYYKGFSLLTAPFGERIKYLLRLSEEIDNPYIEFTTFYGMDCLYDELNSILSRGGEGIVIQSLSGVPEPGLRPAWKSLKIKQELNNPIDVVCTGFIKPTRFYNGDNLTSWLYWENTKTDEKVNTNKYEEYTHGEPWEPVTKNYYNDWLGSIICSAYDDNGALIEICSVSGITEDLKEKIKNNPKDYLGKPMVITGMQTTDDKSIRHPKFNCFRDDMNVEECLMSKIFG